MSVNGNHRVGKLNATVNDDPQLQLKKRQNDEEGEKKRNRGDEEGKGETAF